MNEPYRLPSAEIVHAAKAGDVATVTIDISRADYLSYPIAPADLRQPQTNNSVWQFHQLVDRKGGWLVFETYRTQLQLPQVGSIFDFCSWWLPEAMDAVRDTSVIWEMATSQDDSCNRCLLTYETIAVGFDHGKAYRSKFGWITVDAYREFIERDVLRVRSDWRSIETAT
jgi:hypothetical protein